MKNAVQSLCLAARNGDIEGIRESLAAGADINAAPAKSRNPALIVAAEAGQVEAIEFLLENGAAPDIQACRDGSNALQKAMGKNRMTAVHALLKHEYYQEQATAGYLTSMQPLNTSREIFCMVSDLQFALRKISPVNDVRGWTPLHEAASTANITWASYLLEYGFGNVNCRDESGRIPLHCVRPMRRPYFDNFAIIPEVTGTDAHKNAVMIAALLVAYGADIDAKDKGDKKPSIIDDPAFFGGIKQQVRCLCTGDYPTIGIKHLVPAALQLFVAEAYHPPKFLFFDSTPRPASAPDANRLALEAAATTGDVAKLEQLLPLFPNKNIRLSRKRTALQIAAEQGHVEAVRAIIASGVAPDSAPLGGRTALHLAALKRKSEVITELARAGAQVDAFENGGFTPLMLVAQQCRSGETATALMEAGANPCVSQGPENPNRNKGEDYLSSSNYPQWSALHLAAAHGNLPVLKVFVNAGIGVNLQDKNLGKTPLHVAIPGPFEPPRDAEKCCRLLLESGADPLLADKDGRTSIDIALKYNAVKLLPDLQKAAAPTDNSSSISEKLSGYDRLIHAVINSDPELLKKTLDSGVDLNLRDKDDASVLHCAARLSRVSLMESLVTWGASITWTDKWGETPLHHAARDSKHESVQKLIEMGANVNVQSLHGETPLILACRALSRRSVELLLKAGADPNLLTEGRFSAMTLALSCWGYKLSQKRTRAIARLLLEYGADPDIGTYFGESAAQLTCKYILETMKGQMADEDEYKYWRDRLKRYSFEQLLTYVETGTLPD